MTPLFTVVIPVFNRAAELRNALLSVLAQTEQDFEIVVVDDGSADHPQRTVGQIGDARITIIRQDNRGGGAARNLGIVAARGRYIAFLDSDDRFLPGHLAAMRQLLADRENIAGYAPVVVERGEGKTFLKPPRAIASGEHMATYLLCDRGFVPTITLAVETRLARRIRYDERLSFAQDTDFAIRLYLAGCGFAMAPAPGAVWNDSGDAKRTSAGRKGGRMVQWLEGIRPDIPSRAYYGARGWMIAKGIASKRPLAAFALWLGATLRGCYRPRLALVVFLQIFLSDPAYRALVNFLVKTFRGAVWSRAEHTAQQA